MKRTITLRFLLSLCVMTLVSAFCGGNLASAEEVTFTFPADMSTNKGSYSFTGDIITIDLSSVKRNFSNDQIYVYSSSTITVTCKDAYKITGVSFIGVQSGSLTCDAGTVSSNAWTADASASMKKVVFTNGSTYFKMGKYPNNGIKVSYELESSASESVDPVLTISPDKTLDCLESYTVAAVATDGSGTSLDGTIEYSISPESGDFTFNKETGVFKAGLSGGTYEVTASYSGTTGYNSATATCTITVDDPGVSSWKDYRMVTAQNQILEGVQYLLVSTDNMWAMGDIPVLYGNGQGYAEAKSVSGISNNGISVNAEYSALPIVLEKVGEYYALKTTKGYIKGYETISFGETYFTNDIEYCETVSSEDLISLWTVVIDVNGNAVIRNVKDSDHALMFYSFSDDRKFKNYGYSNYGTENYPYVQLYAKSAEMSISQDALGYGTYAVNFAYQMPAGVKGYAIESVKNGEDGEDAKLQKVEAYNAGDVVPALTPLLVYSEEAAAASKMFYPIVVNKEVSAYSAGNNYLEYKRNGGMTASKKEVPVYYYKLTKKSSDDPAEHKPLGFYWGADDGAAFSMNKSSSAYLALPQSLFAGGLASALLFDEEGQATGIQLTPTTENNTQAIYNLQGVRVSGKLAKGIYIVNGKKVLVK